MSARRPFVLVGGVRYDVKIVPRSTIPDGAHGYTDFKRTTIYIADDLSPAQARAVLKHEIGHAAFYQSGAYTVTKGFTVDPDALEEQILDVFLPVYLMAIGVK